MTVKNETFTVGQSKLSLFQADVWLSTIFCDIHFQINSIKKRAEIPNFGKVLQKFLTAAES